MKKALIILIASTMLLFLTCCAQKHYDESNISQLYNRAWIIGKSQDEIQNKYGNFHRMYNSDSGEDIGAYYVNYDDNIFDSSHIHDTYFIEFNNDGVAVDAYFRQTSIGG